MKKSYKIIYAALMLTASTLGAATSEPTFVFANPDASSFWRTSEGGSVTVPVVYPEGATSATLTVSGFGGTQTLEVTGETCSFSVPTPTSQYDENVYTLTLAFNDDKQTERTAKIGVVTGVGTNTGASRCVCPAGTRKWNKVVDNAVLPIPYGVEAVEVDGQQVPTGLDGAQGWFALEGIPVNATKSVSIDVVGSTYLATLKGGSMGFVLIWR